MNRKRLLAAIIMPPLTIGIALGILLGASWMYDNYPAELGVIGLLVIWAGWSAIIYER